MASPTVRSFSASSSGFDVELLLELHHELDDVERVGAQFVDEARAVDELLALDAELALDDVLDLLGVRSHGGLGG
jgi:hypothetical protein